LAPARTALRRSAHVPEPSISPMVEGSPASNSHPPTLELVSGGEGNQKPVVELDAKGGNADAILPASAQP